jgi:hypothetical protein
MSACDFVFSDRFLFHPQYSAIFMSSDTFDTESGYHSDTDDGTILHLTLTWQNPLASVQVLALSNIIKLKRNVFGADTYLPRCSTAMQDLLKHFTKLI